MSEWTLKETARAREYLGYGVSRWNTEFLILDAKVIESTSATGTISLTTWEL